MKLTFDVSICHHFKLSIHSVVSHVTQIEAEVYFTLTNDLPLKFIDKSSDQFHVFIRCEKVEVNTEQCVKFNYLDSFRRDWMTEKVLGPLTNVLLSPCGHKNIEYRFILCDTHFGHFMKLSTVIELGLSRYLVNNYSEWMFCCEWFWIEDHAIISVLLIDAAILLDNVF